jgi:tetratricopeptide (TPR) repeat protein
MMRFPAALLAISTSILVGACGAGTPQNDEVRGAAAMSLWEYQTSSEEARQQVADGLRELDMFRVPEAYEHMQRAVAADPNSAFAHLAAAWASPSLDAFVTHLNRATELSANASEVERTLVQIYRKQADNDDAGALAMAKRLTELTPENGRSWSMLGDMYDAIADRENARANWSKAIELAPNLAIHYYLLSQSLSTTEPTDFAKAESLARKAVELEPEEPNSHDILGDALRAQGKLDEAAAAYTKAAELDPTKGQALQQRGHVNTFLGRYAEARADYDAAVALATGNAKPTLAMYRTLVSLYEGNAQATLDELEQLHNSIDGMQVEEPVGMKIFVTGPQFNIAVHYGMVEAAERYNARLDQLAEAQIAQAKSAEFERASRAGRALRHAHLAIAKGDFTYARARMDDYTTLRANDNSPAKMRPVHNLAGFIALKEKRYDDAVSELELGTPNNIYWVYQHALALEGAGRTADAQRLFARVANYYFSNEGTALVRKDALAKAKATT